MQFEIFGPFEIPRDRKKQIDDNLDEFWGDIDHRFPGLSDAKGCYVFGIRASGGATITPWYVGKTNARSFRNECFTTHKWKLYHKSLAEYKKGTPFLFVIALQTQNMALSTASRPKTLKFLEEYLIGLAINRNEKLQNKQSTKFYREIRVPGLLNQGTENRKARKALRDTLSFD